MNARAVVLAGLLVTLGWTSGVAADEVAAARAAHLAAVREYRASLDRLRPFREEAVARAAAAVVRGYLLFARGIVSRRDVAEGEGALAEARAALEATRVEMAQADTLGAEAEAAVELASLPAPRPGELGTTGTLIRYHGAAPWSPAEIRRVERLFAERFGRPLPVSALGQTTLHDRLGFDHRNAMDVAVHPDSPEGQALMAWLRSAGVPFLTFRVPRSGVATGAHVHIGEPSPPTRVVR